jgi:hypothetical protein
MPDYSHRYTVLILVAPTQIQPDYVLDTNSRTRAETEALGQFADGARSAYVVDNATGFIVYNAGDTVAGPRE